MTRNSVLIALSFILLLFSACKKETTETFLLAPFLTDTLTLSGLSGTETGATTELKGGNALRSVFVDLSKGVQTPVLRTSWDIGLYAGADFRVILNHSTGATAIRLDKNSLADVSSADTLSLATGKVLDLGNSLTTVDPFTGIFSDYLSHTVIDEVSATDADNKVYIINRGLAGGIAARAWEKIRIVRSGSGYKLSYALINATSQTDVIIAKDPSFNFKFFYFNAAAPVLVEPAKKLWDIEWTYSTYKTSDGKPVGTPDFVLINYANGVEAAQIKFTTDSAFEKYAEADLSTVTWSAGRDVIGTNWRNLNEAANNSSVYRDRFYLIKDTEGNIYALRFNSFIKNDGGNRGKPNLDYRLIKAGAN